MKNVAIYLTVFRCLFLAGLPGSDLNQRKGGLRCEFQMTGLSQRKYNVPILRLKFPILFTQVTNTINY